MVLVSYILYSSVRILHTACSSREGHEARRVGLSTMPLDQHIAGRHGARQACLTIRPAPMQHLCAMADQPQHRAPRLDEQTVLPRAALTPLQGAGSPRRGLEAGGAHDHQALCALPHPPLPGVVGAMGRGPRPGDEHPPLLEPETQCTPTNPAVMGAACAAARLGPPACAHGVAQRHPLRLQAPQDRRGGQEGRGPVLRRLAEAQEPGPLRSPGTQRPRVAGQAALARPLPPPLRACHSPKGTTARGPRRASGCVGRARLGASTGANNAVRHSTVVMGSSVHGRVSRSCPVWRKCMTSARRSTSTIGL